MAFDWFKRKAQNITTSTDEKKDLPKGLWHKTPSGKIVEHEELMKNNYVSPEDGFHVRIGSAEFFDILFDERKFKELDANVESIDIQNSKDFFGEEILQQYIIIRQHQRECLKAFPFPLLDAV